MKKTILLRPPAFRRIHFIVLLFISCITVSDTVGQCFATSTVSGSAAVNDASVGSVAFNDEENSLVSDDDNAYATALIALFNGSSNYLKVTGFGFNIPSYASVCGVVVEIEKRATGLAVGAWIRDNSVRIVKANNVTGTDQADAVTDWGSEINASYGGGTDLWGTTLTPAEVNSPNFGVAISARMRGLVAVFPSARIDNIRITVYYNPILPVKLLSFHAGLKNNIATLNWETADEEDNEVITLQRSVAGQDQWIDLQRYELQTSNQRKRYSYADALARPGNYAYRLMMTHKTGQHTFSEIRQLEYSPATQLVAYPNPASDFINLDNIQDTRQIIITNIINQQLSLPVHQTGRHSVRIEIQSLAQGIYFIRSGKGMLKFIKD